MHELKIHEIKVIHPIASRGVSTSYLNDLSKTFQL
jgi:hypothetical protein